MKQDWHCTFICRWNTAQVSTSIQLAPIIQARSQIFDKTTKHISNNS